MALDRYGYIDTRRVAQRCGSHDDDVSEVTFVTIQLHALDILGGASVRYHIIPAKFPALSSCKGESLC